MNQPIPSLRELVYSQKTKEKSQNFQFSFEGDHEEEGEEASIYSPTNWIRSSNTIKPMQISEIDASKNPINDLLSTKFFFYNREALNHKRSIYSSILPFTKRIHTIVP